MGLSGSKHNGPGPSPSPSSSEGAVRRCRSSRSRVLKPSCLRSHRSDNDEPQITKCPNEDNGKNVSCCSSESKVSNECYRTDGAAQSSDGNCVNSDVQLCDAVAEEGNTSRDFSSRSLNPPSRFLSRFSFYPGNLSLRLTRVNSLVSRRSNPASSSGFAISNEEEDCVGPSGDLVSGDDRPQGCDFLPACFTNRPPRTRDERCVSELSYEDNRRSDSDHSGLRNIDGARPDCSPNLFSPIDHLNSDGAGVRDSERRFSTREPAERNVRFSRTLSVGRLRDRVLRRTSAADMDLYHFQQNGEERLTRPGAGRRGSVHAEVAAATDVDNISQEVSSDTVPSSFSETFYGSHSHVYDTTRSRETRYRDLLEYRSNFLERRRRIRSQVRALQRLGNRFENMSGHERSCILSGQNWGGHCTCCNAARGEMNSNDDANARASISRIVMLAEALFEVLDEIHQQSVVLSSRPSVSPIGAIPAPNEVVDSLPLKTFTKLKRKPCDDTAQCYICLVEYDDGDCIRTLPCHHEFHRECVDKWLKEIHRVCPLCRGDICRPDLLPSRS